ncbi:BtrH N-terminal domain-containing protein [Falsibacillus albus]|nr:BtrH N-terminal domain-containing protein [Falsibacillus albus]
MTRILMDFPNRPGMHCASKSLRDIGEFYGHDLSEAEIFGLSSGLGAVYINLSEPIAIRLFGGRILDLESGFFKNMDIPFKWRFGPVFRWNEIRSYIDRNIPVIVIADLKYLDYYQTNSLFGGHSMVIIGYDDVSEEVFLVDVNQPDIQRLKLSSLKRAMSSYAPGFPFKTNQWAPVEQLPLLQNASMYAKAIEQNAYHLLKDCRETFEAFADDIRKWNRIETWKYFSITLYEMIERRGSGGAAFRNLYIDFLRTWHRKYGDDYSGCEDVISGFQASIDGWNEFSSILLQAARRGTSFKLNQAADRLHDIYEKEEACFVQLKELLKAPAVG